LPPLSITLGSLSLVLLAFGYCSQCVAVTRLRRQQPLIASRQSRVTREYAGCFGERVPSGVKIKRLDLKMDLLEKGGAYLFYPFWATKFSGFILRTAENSL